MKPRLLVCRWKTGLQYRAQFDIGGNFKENERTKKRPTGKLFDVSPNEQYPKYEDGHFHPRQLELDEGDSGFDEIQKVFTVNRPMVWEGRGMSRCLRLYVIFSVYN